MAESDPSATQRNPAVSLTAELDAAGFVDAEEIGRGGFGIVYRCRQPSLDRVVAVKVLTDDLDQENLDRFLREQHAMGRVSGHPHIVHLLHVDVTDSGTPFLVMPYHARGSLDAKIRRHGPLRWDEALGLGVKLAGALETAHRVGILHRDVKPANILLSDYGDPQLTDFGIARIAGGFETATGAVTGTPAFTAPEVLKGEAPSPASDVYSLGATLFAAITGHAAFERQRGEQVVAQFLRITTEPVPDLSEAGIPDEVSAAIADAMAADPHDRPATAAAFGDTLRETEASSGLSIDEMALPGDADSSEQAPRSTPRASIRIPSPRAREVRASVPPAPGTKFRPTTSTRPWVPRSRLIDLLRAGQGRRLTVIHAPAGYGKSTLAAQWARVLAEEGFAVAWLTVDRDDNNVVWFLAHLIEAIRRVRPTLAHELADVLEEHGDQAERYVLTSLINDIHERDERIVLVIDDWHRVTDTATTAAMEFMLDNCCHHLQVLVTSRSQAGLPLSRMRVRGELTEIDSSTLRFNDIESQSFLVDTGGLVLEPREVADLTKSVDGWVAALQLASLSLRGYDDPTHLIGHMSGRHHAIAEFLAENVLDTLEPEILQFLLATSITERICGTLASMLTGAVNGQALLEEVERRDLFLRRIDEDGEWFRYHHLFRDFLRQRLERDQPERIRELHRSASLWFADHAQLSQAVDHAVAAADDQSAVDLVESRGLDLVEHSQMASLLALVAKLPSALVSASPRLLLTIAWANINLMRPLPARTALDLVESALARANHTEREATHLRIEAAVARGAVDVSTDHVDGVDELVSECLARPETLAPFVVSAAADVATFLGIYSFDFASARRWQRWAQPYHQRASGPLTATYGYCLDGIAAYEMLDIPAAEECFRNALAAAKRSGGSRSYAVRLASALLGRLLYELGDLNQAEHLIDESCELDSDCAVVDFMLTKYVIGARIKALRGDRDSAIGRLEEGSRTAEEFALPRLRAAVRNERIRLGIPAAAGFEVRVRAAADEDASQPVGHPGDGIDEIVAEIDDSSVILRLLGEQSANQTHRAYQRAQDLVERLEVRGRPRALLEAQLLLIACLSAAGGMGEAKRMLAPIAATCSQLGLSRVLVDHAGPVRDVVAALQEDHMGGRWQSDWPTVSSAFLAETLSLAEQSPLLTADRGGQ
ncbi:protein kinase [Rhodococcus sp. NPDC057529]|uniref:protein kinase domain-containing protein n=1 Tax=Rhodococcus sp. NPDC057529 TaxID=3346158 RepID=UPI00366B2298